MMSHFFFKPVNTLLQSLARQKDKILKEQVVGPVYHIPCDSCDASYIGKTEKLLKALFWEHRRPGCTTSEVSRHIHIDNPEHQVEMDGVIISAVEPRWFK